MYKVLQTTLSFRSSSQPRTFKHHQHESTILICACVNIACLCSSISNYGQQSSNELMILQWDRHQKSKLAQCMYSSVLLLTSRAPPHHHESGGITVDWEFSLLKYSQQSQIIMKTKNEKIFLTNNWKIQWCSIFCSSSVQKMK